MLAYQKAFFGDMWMIRVTFTGKVVLFSACMQWTFKFKIHFFLVREHAY